MPHTGATTPRIQRRRAASNLGRSGDKRALYHCNYCQKDISSRIRIKCAECPDFDLCLECFSVGVEVKPHKRHHAYRVIDNLSFPLYEPTWGADEELLLLEAVDMYGLGNWAATAEHVGTKTEQECRKHYYEVYIDHDDHPRPKPTEAMAAYEREAPADDLGRQPLMKTPELAKPSKSQSRVDMQDDPQSVVSSLKSITGAAGGLEGGTLAAAGGESNPAGGDPAGETSDLTAAKGGKAHAAAKGSSAAHKSARPPTEEAPPATPRSASQAVPAPVEAQRHSTDQRSLRNVAEVTGYNIKRNEFEPEYDNDAELVICDLDFPEGEPEEERRLKLRLVEIYNSRLDGREKRKNAILGCGLLDVKSAEEFEKTLGPVEQKLNTELRALARFQSAEEHRALIRGLAVEHHLRARIEALKECRRSGARTLADAEAFESSKRRRRLASQPGSAQAARSARSSSREDTQPALAALRNAKESRRAPATDSRASAAALLKWRVQERGVALDISALPGVELLTRGERRLCANTRLTPPQFLAAKHALLQESRDRGYVTRQQAVEMLGLDALKAARVHELLAGAGELLEAEPGGAAAVGGPTERDPEEEAAATAPADG
uniref:Transcriptional adapter n=1 Tax=Tetraselmis sp. GSL018 TaxID=582737 RepID=A0A061RHS0_9CHLO|mmetsp:Transcript_13689/g.32426  ORF Transcript_13689/g.32426 Transcript_13689/m.32426 type:complete len:608 (-) Transcript_13689:41-1864(-)|eukprot:CAMPEP_0177585296 /NCGR_PEP_ID=MMETSP0419_2-20121207/4404_1 /TAXON_ID=582737 /ORGANISM="Tetraselmis sp., Strain GSL018" /LENGTH=607 /DNA_ID=CAMNT_0019074993 /DNA_START=342 /DNA_END=2165 /DNA_ORIENTATION=+